MQTNRDQILLFPLLVIKIKPSQTASSVSLKYTGDDNVFSIVLYLSVLSCVCVLSCSSLPASQSCRKEYVYNHLMPCVHPIVQSVNSHCDLQFYLYRAWDTWLLSQCRLLHWVSIQQIFPLNYQYITNYKYHILLVSDFRSAVAMSKEEMMTYAGAQLKKNRNRVQLKSDTMLYPQCLTEGMKWGPSSSSKELTTRSLPWHFIKGKGPRDTSSHWNEDFMSSFLDGVDRTSVFMPLGVHLREFLPNSTTLLDHYCFEESRRMDLWTFNPDVKLSVFQDHRNVCWDLLTTVQVKEIVVNVTAEDDIKEIGSWLKSKYEEDQKHSPTGTISLSVEYATIARESFEELVYNGAGEGSSVKVRVNLEEDERASQFPLKLLIGNGYTWAVVITFPFPKIGQDDSYVYVDRYQLQPSLTQLLLELPIVVALGVKTDLSLIETVIQGISGDLSFNFRGCYDLSTLAVLAGFNFPFLSLQTLSVQVLGSVLNLNVYQGDGRWGYLWKHVPKSLRVYTLGTLKTTHMVTVVLFMFLINDVFPDPDIVLSFLRTDQRSFGQWFGRWVAHTLEGTYVDFDLMETANGRIGLLKSILAEGEENAASMPRRVRVFMGTLGDWPTMPKGGFKYLHNARTFFLFQCDYLEKRDVIGWDIIMPYDVDDEMRECATYALPGLLQLDFKTPTSIACGPTVHLDILHKTLHGIKAEEMNSQRVKDVAEDYNRIRRELTYEWVRLNLSEMEKFFKLIRNDRYYRNHIKSYYDELRMIYLRCTGTPAPKVIWIEQHILKGAQKNKESALLKAQQLEREALEWRAIAAFHERRISKGELDVESATWRAQVPKITPKNPAKKKHVKGSRLDFRPTDYYSELDEATRRVEEVSGSGSESDTDSDSSGGDDGDESVEIAEERVVRLREADNGEPSRPAKRQRVLPEPGRMTEDEVDDYVSLKLRASSSPELL